jgi:hypothetical protein
MGRDPFRWKSLPWPVQALDVALPILFFLYTFLVYRSWTGNIPYRAPADREIGSYAVGTFITVAVAGASLLMTAVGVLLSLKPLGNPVPRDVFTELVVAALWLVVSLAAGAISASYVLNHLHFGQSVAEHPLVIAFASAQLLALIVGATLFVVSLFLF